MPATGHDDEVISGDNSDGRRARMADVNRLSAQVAALEAKVDSLTDALVKRDAEPVGKAQFYGQFFAMATLGGRKAQHLRAECDQAWGFYLDAMSGKPRIPLGGTPGADYSVPSDLLTGPADAPALSESAVGA